MSKSDAIAILTRVTDFYLQSHDFNGIPVAKVALDLGVERDTLAPVLATLVAQDELSVLFPDVFPNTHILTLRFEDVTTQLEKLTRLRDFGLHHVCLYPSVSHLASVVKREEYQGRPFTLRLALGEPQIRHYSFDLSVLELYRNDPRYYYRVDDISGEISIKDDRSPMRKSDEVLLQTFGFSYDDEMNRAVAVFLRYLTRLTPEHQQIWNAKILDDQYKLHPDYYKSSILGEWGGGISIFEAFTYEIHYINEICKLMPKPPLFRREVHGAMRPRELGFLLRPTLGEYNDFVLLLDRLLSDNINKDFFRGDINLEREMPRRDGRIEVQQKGTLQLLEEWILKCFVLQDQDALREVMGALREVRRQRQQPAHALNENEFDQVYIERQRELMIQAYVAVNNIRLLFSNHPNAKAYKAPGWRDHDTIWTY